MFMLAQLAQVLLKKVHEPGPGQVLSLRLAHGNACSCKAQVHPVSHGIQTKAPTNLHTHIER